MGGRGSTDGIDADGRAWKAPEVRPKWVNRVIGVSLCFLLLRNLAAIEEK
jgi:hypothetical protein